jgi:uncharacterized protein YjiS (DUF1127 family)
MAFITGTAPAFGLGDKVASLVERLRTARKVRAVYRQTYNELADLTDRDLADLGLHRTQIRAVALQAAEMARG